MKKYFLIISIFLTCAMNLFAQTNYFPVSHRIVTNTVGTAPMQDASMIPDIMSELNKAFAPANIQFFLSCVTTRSHI